jgi:hypothetical protein
MDVKIAPAERVVATRFVESCASSERMNMTHDDRPADPSQKRLSKIVNELKVRGRERENIYEIDWPDWGS